MSYVVIALDHFTVWYQGLDIDTAEGVNVVVDLLEQHGPQLRFPYSSDINTPNTSNLRELRKQHRGHPIRILYAFDPRRQAVLILGADKTGDARWYDTAVPKADKLFQQYLRDEYGA